MVEHFPLVLAEKLERMRIVGGDRIVGVDAGDEGVCADEIRRWRRGGGRQKGDGGEKPPQLTDPQNRWMRVQASSSRALEVA